MEEKQLLQSALNEIKSLRKQNELMKVRLDMFDDVMSALHGKPASQQSVLMMHPDIVFEIEKHLANEAN